MATGVLRKQELHCTVTEMESNQNKVLLDGEVIYVDCGNNRWNVKIGDGVTTVSSLPYVIEYATIEQAIEVATEAAELAQTTASGLVDANTESETSRAESETARQSAETGRSTAEQTRQTQEATRQANEQTRVANETGRSTAEASRVSAENARQSAETSRAESETARQSAETGRSTAEQTRQTQEATRQATYNSKSPAIDDTQASATNPWSGAKISLELTNDRNRIGVLEHVAADFDLSYAQISEIVRNGEAARYFNIGDKIVVPWTDVADNVTYQVPHVFTHFENVTLQDGSVVPSAYLQWQYCSPFGVMFDAYEAFYYAPNGLSAGTYTVTIGANWGSFAHTGDQWNFTLTQDVPAGGRLSGFKNLPDYDMSTRSVYSWASPTSLTPQETVAIVSGAAGTALCTLEYSSHSDTVNSMQRVGYGYNRYDQSAIRQYLNSNAAASAWWTSQNDFDCPPDKLSLKAGFAGGYTDDFLTMTKPIKITTALNAAESGLSASTDTCDTFFLPSTQQINVSAQITNESEGAAWDYWKQSLGSDSLVGYGSNNIFDAFKIGAINAQTSPQYVRLRSAYRSAAYGTWIVYSSGYVGSGTGAYSAFRFAPACAIC